MTHFKDIYVIGEQYPVAVIAIPEVSNCCPACEGQMKTAEDLPIDGGEILRCTKCGHLTPIWKNACNCDEPRTADGDNCLTCGKPL